MDKSILMSTINVNDVFQNPKKGTSTVVRITEKYIYYIRGHSKLSLPIDAFFSAIDNFSHKKCTSTDLKQYMPDVFSSKHNGHDCNCTFLFLIAEKLGLIESGILGTGVLGSPYYVVFK